MVHFEMPDAGHIRKRREELKDKPEERARLFQKMPFMERIRGNILETSDINYILREKYEDEVLGSGTECIVVPIEGSDEKVAAYNYEKDVGRDPLLARSLFYRQRILSTLFPHNFPHFYAAFAKTDDNPHGTIRQKIDGQKPPLWGLGRYRAYKDVTDTRALARVFPPLQRNAMIRFPFSKVKEECMKMGLDIKEDVAPNNYMLGTDGGEYYVDVIHGLDPTEIDEQIILQYMDENGYDDTAKSVVSSSIQRVKAIWGEHLARQKSG